MYFLLAFPFVLFARINARIREMLRHTKYSTHNTRNTRDNIFAYTRSATIVHQRGWKRGAGNQSYPRSRIFFRHCLPRSTFIRNTSFIVADEVSLQHARLRNSNFVFKDESTRVIMYGEHVQRMQHRVPEAKLRWNRRNFVFTIPPAFAVKLPLSVNIKARRPPPWIVTKILRIQLSWETWGRWGTAEGGDFDET